MTALRLCLFAAVAAMLSIGSTPLASQLPVPIELEARAGIAIPSGSFAGEDSGAGAQAGPFASFGLRVEMYRPIALYGGAQVTRFGCNRCPTYGLDDAIVASGLEAGVHLEWPVPVIGVSPWVRAGAIHQVLRYSGDGDHLVSSPGLGIGASSGVAILIGRRWRVSGGVRFQSVGTQFRFASFPERSVDATAVGVDLGGAFRF